MDTYSSEKEQIESIKKWWDENGKAIVFGLTIGLTGLFGYRYWDSSRTLAGESASNNFEHLFTVAQAGPSDEAQAAGEAVIAEAPDSPYARMAALMLAKLAVEANDYEQAKLRLQWVVDQGKGGEITDIAAARLAQLLLAQDKVDEAQAAFDRLSDESRADFPELNGDLLLAAGDHDGAREKYEIAIEQARELGVDAEPAELKLNNMNRLYVDTP